MDILCVIDSLGSGGAQRQLVELAIAFKEHGHKVSFLVYHPLFFFKNILDEYNIQVTCIEETSYIKRFWKLRKHIRSGNYDAILAFLEAPSLICELSRFPKCKWKLVVGERSASPSILNSAKARIIRFFHLFADYVVANSHENIRLVKKACPLLSKEKCKVIYNIVDFNRFSPNINHIYRNNGKINIIVAASHQYIKNLKGLVEAINLLTEEEKRKLEVVWYGRKASDGSDIECRKLINKYNLNDIIFFKSDTKEIHQIFQQADVIGLFSYYEGLPNTICEAMAVGKPVIASKVSDIPLLIRKKELMFEPTNIDLISKTLSVIIDLDTNELIKEGIENRNLALSLFDKEKIYYDYINLLEKN